MGSSSSTLASKCLSFSPLLPLSLMTTQRLTSRRPRPRMLKARLLDLSPLLFPMAVSRPPPTPLTTTTDSLLRSPMREPLSTPQSPQVDTDTPPLPTSPLLKFQYILMKKPNSLLQISTKTDGESCSQFSSWESFAGFQDISQLFLYTDPFHPIKFLLYLFIYLLK